MQVPLLSSSPPQAPETTTSATFIEESSVGIRGRKVPPRRAAVFLDRHLPHSASVQCEHPAALRSSAAGSFQAVTPLPPQAPEEESRPSTPRYGFAVVIPARYSSRPFRRSTCARSSLWPSLTLWPSSGPCSFRDGKAFRAGRIRPSRPLAQTVSVIADLFGSIRRRPESALPATDCAVPHASTSLPPASIRWTVPVRVEGRTPLELPTALTRWAVPAQAGEAVCLPHHAGLCRGLGA